MLADWVHLLALQMQAIKAVMAVLEVEAEEQEEGKGQHKIEAGMDLQEEEEALARLTKVLVLKALAEMALAVVEAQLVQHQQQLARAETEVLTQAQVV